MTDIKRKEKQIVVSVILPVYNVEDYLEQCLDSICQQTLNDIEILCIDDGSTDDSRAILQKYACKDSRIHLILQNNKGAGAARNVGLTVAKGKYLSFLDADDFFEKDFLNLLYQKAEKTEADIVVCSAFEYDSKEKTAKKMSHSLKVTNLPDKDIFSYKDMPDYIFNSFQNWAWNKLFRTEFVQKHNIKFQEIMRTNDLFFTCKALVMAERISIVADTLIYYRVNHGGNCQTTNNRAPLDFYKAFYKLKSELQNQNLYESVKKSYLNWALEGCMYNLKSLRKSKSRIGVTCFLEREGIKNLGLEQMQYSDCQRKMACIELFLLKKHFWSMLDTVQTLKSLKKILK